MRRAKVRSDELGCDRFHVSPELAAVVIAADRVADLETRLLVLSYYRGPLIDSPEIAKLREAVKNARAAAEKRDGYKPKKKDMAL